MSTTQVQVELGQKVQERAKLSVALTAKKRLRPIPKGTSATRFSIPHHPMDGSNFPIVLVNFLCLQFPGQRDLKKIGLSRPETSLHDH